MSHPEHYPLSDYSGASPAAPVFRLEAKPHFSPLDLNLTYLARSGWNQAVDRLRLHTEQQSIPSDHPLASAIGRFGTHLLIRRLEHDEDCFCTRVSQWTDCHLLKRRGFRASISSRRFH